MSRNGPSRPRVIALAGALLLLAGGTYAWWSQTHVPMTSAAAALLPGDAPEFFRKGTNSLAPYSADPDIWKDKAAPMLRAAEGPNHYLDLELLRDRALPENRWLYVKLCREVKTTAVKAGFLPYSIQEWHDRLMLAFAEHRKWPKDKRVQAKALYIGGVLAHYTCDASQPLHTTIHYDGRLRPDGSSPRSGIHGNVDALPEKLGLTAKEILRGAKPLKPVAREKIFRAAMAFISAAHAKVDLVYRLEKKLPDSKAPPLVKADAEVRAFAAERARAAASFTAQIWYSAWKSSKDVKLPEWHKAYETSR